MLYRQLLDRKPPSENANRRSTKDQVVDALIEWMPELNMKADLTLKLRAKWKGSKLSVKLREDEHGPAMVVRTLNRLNRYVLKTERKARRLAAVAFLEFGPTTDRPHLHLLIERPESVSIDDFRNDLLRAWKDQPFAHRMSVVEPIRSLKDCLHYAAKGGVEGMVYFHKHEPKQGEQAQ